MQRTYNREKRAAWRGGELSFQFHRRRHDLGRCARDDGGDAALLCQGQEGIHDKCGTEQVHGVDALRRRHRRRQPGRLNQCSQPAGRSRRCGKRADGLRICDIHRLRQNVIAGVAQGRRSRCQHAGVAVGQQ
ncbi:hypothetical protein QTI68_39365 [Variovorax sp. J31P207]|nr:hypothetical protein [Variovorax sp. J31P207]MDM0072616.1 hypothetical protein [Variovorax sp. J31P207]